MAASKTTPVFMFTRETAENKQFNIKRRSARAARAWRRARLIPTRHLKVLRDSDYHLPDLKAPRSGGGGVWDGGRKHFTIKGGAGDIKTRLFIFVPGFERA